MAAQFPPCPASLKAVQHYLKIAQEHDGRDIVVSYWSRLYALQVALKASSQLPDETNLLLALMDWLEKTKKEHSDNEAITNEIAAQAHLENYALKLFLYADKQDRECNFVKNVVKAFYTCGVLYDVLQTFGDLTDEATHNRKYAKWKAAYIHNCLKNGEIPIPGPMVEGGDEELEGDQLAGAQSGEGENNRSPMQPTMPTDNPNPNDVPQPTFPAKKPPTVEEVLSNPEKLPSPPVDEEKPGGFEPFVPPAQPEQFGYIPPPANVRITAEQMIKAQKYCKYAGSALNYDDVNSAVENLRKALHLLTTGEEL